MFRMVSNIPQRGRTISVREQIRNPSYQQHLLKELQQLSQSVDTSQAKDNFYKTNKEQKSKPRFFGQKVVLKPLKLKLKDRQSDSMETHKFNRLITEHEQKIQQLIAPIKSTQNLCEPDKLQSYPPNLIQKPLDYVLKYSMRSKRGTQANNKMKINQDIYVSSLNCGHNLDIHAFAVGDGHGPKGHLVSSDIREAFKQNLDTLKETKEFKINQQWVHKLHLQLSDQLLENKSIDSNYSGSTFVSVYIQNHTLICANVGDSRAVMGKQSSNGKWLAEPLTKDHKPSDQEEADRIKKNNGRVCPIKYADGTSEGPLRIWLKNELIPGLAVTRSFGDKVARMIGLSSEPQVKEYQLNQQSKIVVLGSDGVWDQISNQEIIEILSHYYEKSDLENACKYLLSLLLTRWGETTSSTDDITFAILFLYYQ